MARHINLECGPISFACDLYAAHGQVKDGLTNTHTLCGSTLSAPKFCRACNREVVESEITKNYKIGSKTLIPITSQEIEALPIKRQTTIQVVQFFTGPIDPRLYGEHLYYIGVSAAPRAYMMLCAAMRQPESTVRALARYNRALYILEIFEGVLQMREIVYAADFRMPDDVRAACEQAMRKATVDARAQNAVNQLVTAMTGPLALEDARNTYQDALEALVEAKAAGKVVVTAPVADAPAIPDDGLADAIHAYLAGQGTTQTIVQPATIVVAEAEDEVVLPW